MQQFTFKRDALPILTVFADRTKDQQLFFITDMQCSDIELWKARGFNWTVQMLDYEGVKKLADDMNCQLFVFEDGKQVDYQDFESAVKITVNQQISKNDIQSTDPVYENGEGGVVSGAGMVNPGEQCTLSFTANPGYAFAGWFGSDGLLLSQDEEYTFEVDHSISIIARSNLQWYDIEITNNNTQGTVEISGDADNRIAYGAQLTVTVTRKTGYTLHMCEVTTGEQMYYVTDTNSITVEGDVTITTSWDVYNVTIDAKVDPTGSGTWNEEASESYQEGTQHQITFTPGENYDFANLTYATVDDPTGEETLTKSTSSISDFIWYQGRKVTAHCTPKTYTVTFNANGGEVTEGTRQVVYNTAVGELPTPTREATIQYTYNFQGWFTETEAGEQITAETVISSDITYYAHWEAVGRSYTLTANANGGTIPATEGWTGEGETVTKSISYGGKYGTLPTPTRSATAQYTYTFQGWFTDASAGTAITAESTMTTSGATIYAHWDTTVNEYTVTPKAAYRDTDGTGDYTEGTTGGTVSGGGEVEYGGETVINASVTTGYKFDGWYTTIEGTQLASSLAEYDVKNVEEDIVLYALYTKQYFTVSTSNGENVTSTLPASQRVAYNGTSTTITATVPEAYNTPTFSISGTGTLNDNGDGTCTVSAVTSDITVTSATTIKTFAVTANAAYRDTDNTGNFTQGTTGGTVSGGNTVNYGSSITLTAAPATGYTFQGWFTSLSGEGEAVSTNATYEIASVTSAITYYARFQKNWYTVTYAVGDYIESVNPTSERVAYGTGITTGSTATVMTDTAQYNYEFDGWYGPDASRLTTNLHVTDIGANITGDKTITAKGTRTIQEYTITLAVSPAEAGTTTQTMEANYGAEIALNATPNSGYVFDHWENSAQTNLGSDNPLMVTVTGDETYTAVFTAETGA